MSHPPTVSYGAGCIVLRVQRSALWAAHVCHWMHLQQHNQTKREEWLEAAQDYEAWAKRVLDMEKDVEAAAKQLTFAGDGFDASAIDHAIVHEPGARPCRNFIAHVHCMDVAGRFFHGDFPGSRACIAPAGWGRILLHVLCLGLLPIVDVQERGSRKSTHWSVDDDDTDLDDDAESDEEEAEAKLGEAGRVRAGLLAPLRPLRSMGFMRRMARPANTLYNVASIPCVKCALSTARFSNAASASQEDRPGALAQIRPRLSR